ncbi:hypothetical protein MMC14_008163 [Varicellaria rhodocarpa]|nr:hypothetical protein [Varicellaria rhodocarpa]
MSPPRTESRHFLEHTLAALKLLDHNLSPPGMMFLGVHLKSAESKDGYVAANPVQTAGRTLTSLVPALGEPGAAGFQEAHDLVHDHAEKGEAAEAFRAFLDTDQLA